jgi:periplasmic mercuric ion binding protein
MRTPLILLVAIISMVGFTAARQAEATTTETFKVYGNCGMCKATIERALKKKDGIVSRNWNVETKMLTVTFYPSKITLEQVHQKVAAVGYDTELARAPDAVYEKLHPCCHYERPAKTPQ